MGRTSQIPWLLVVLPVLLAMAGCRAKSDEAPPYPILDSGFPASTIDKLYWLDNDRVIFVSYGPKPKSVGEAHKHPRVPSINIWNTRTNSVTLYKDSAKGLCADGSFIQYAIAKVPYDPEYQPKWYAGQIGQEREITLPLGRLDNSIVLNPHTCRWVERPEYAKADFTQWKQPLREEDGWLIEDADAKEWAWRRSDGRMVKTGIPHSVLGSEWLKFAGAYFFQLIPGGDQILKTDCIRYWWLKPDGSVNAGCRDVREVKKVDIHSGVALYPTKLGMLFVAGNTQDYNPGTAGLYQLSAGGLKRIVSGGMEQNALSPSGCKIVYTHVPFSEARRVGAPGDVHLKLVNLCKTNRGSKP